MLLDAVMAGLACRPGGRYLDCTIGRGGVASCILEHSGPDGLVIGFDRDAAAIAACCRSLATFGDRVRLLHGDFRDMKAHLQAIGVSTVHGVVFDLGVSSAQLDDPARGFSFQHAGPLDMRMDQANG
ncbi:MAG: 16S rRNA (cytosine(1402)-N(4))-methyltransferase, partial [Nitrospirales bacterium]